VAEELEKVFTEGTKDTRYKRGSQLQVITALNEEFNSLIEPEKGINELIWRITRNHHIEKRAAEIVKRLMDEMGVAEK
jgi:hypothetical protein